MNPATRYRLGGVVIGGGIVLSFAHHLQFAGVFSESPAETAAAFIPSVLAAGAALWLGSVIRSGGIPKTALDRAAMWYLGGALLLALALYVSFSATFGSDALPPDLWFSIRNWAIAGSALGLVVANYDLRRAAALRRATANERTATHVSQRLSVVDRVLRHDIRNKLNIILGYASSTEGDGIREDDALAVVAAAESLMVIVERARHFRSVLEKESPEPLDLTELLREVTEGFREEYPEAQVTIVRQEEITARTYPEFRNVLEELFENAVVHNPRPEAECQLAVSLRRVRTDEGAVAEILLEDNGPGIPEREQLVQTDDLETQLDHSSGTSLWLARWVLDASDGDLAIESANPEGTRLVLRLPIADSDAGPASPD